MHGYGRPQYTNINYPYPVDPPQVPSENPVGLYRRLFALPAEWDGKQVFLHFDGVDSAFHRLGQRAGGRLQPGEPHAVGVRFDTVLCGPAITC